MDALEKPDSDHDKIIRPLIVRLCESFALKDNLAYLFATFLAALLVATLVVNMVIPTVDILIVIVILVLLLSDKFSVFKIPGFLEMRKEVDNLKQGQQELVRTTQALMQINATLQQTISTVQQNNININITQPELERRVQRTEQLLESATPQIPVPPPAETPDPEVQTIQEFYTKGQNIAAFATLRATIEKKLWALLHTAHLPIPRNSISNRVRLAVDRELLDINLADAIETVVHTANKIIHSDAEGLTESSIERMINLGIKVIIRLNEITERRRQHPSA